MSPGLRNSRIAQRMVYVLLGVILLWAAMAKIWLLRPADRLGLLASKEIFTTTVIVELSAAFWFLCLAARSPLLTRYLGSALFGVLASVSTIALIRNQPCQCFGPSESSAFPLLIDIAAIAALWLLPVSQPLATDMAATAGWTFRPWAAVSWSVFAVFMEVGAWWPADWRLATSTGSGIEILEPHEWLNQECPLLPYARTAEDLRTGEWLVVLYRPDCGHCQELVPQLVRRCASTQRPRLALLNVSSDAGTRPSGEGSVVWGQLDRSRQWFVTTPVGILLVDGEVQRVLEEESLHAFVGSVHPRHTFDRPTDVSSPVVAIALTGRCFAEAGAMADPQISINIPTVNEADNVAILVPRVVAALHTAAYECQIVVVDDARTDGTPDVVNALGGDYRVRLIERRGDTGLASAVMAGVRSASHMTVRQGAGIM